MTYPHVTQFDETALRPEPQRQVALELEATRGRSMWRERPAKRRRFRLRAARA